MTQRNSSRLWLWLVGGALVVSSVTAAAVAFDSDDDGDDSAPDASETTLATPPETSEVTAPEPSEESVAPTPQNVPGAMSEGAPREDEASEAPTPARRVADLGGSAVDDISCRAEPEECFHRATELALAGDKVQSLKIHERACRAGHQGACAASDALRQRMRVAVGAGE